METMDQRGPLERRVEALESAVGEMSRTLSRLALDVNKVGTQAAAPQVPVAPQQVLCPRCQGGNAPLSERCRWCGLALSGSAEAAELSQAQAPLASGPPVQVPVSVQTVPSLAGDATTRRLISSPVRTTGSPLDMMRRTGFWLNKVGIALFLFGVAFLFKYAIDNNWLNEYVRLACGLALGSALLGFGFWANRTRHNLSQVLIGGGVATYYITAYASYVLYPNLHIPFEVAFDFMALVTLMALVLSVRYGDVSLSLVGVIGGLLTPFVLNNRLDAPALMGYMCLLLAFSSDVYLLRGWRSLLWVSFFGGWFVLLYTYSARIVLSFDAGPILSDRWALQGGAAFLLLAFWAVPVIREVLAKRKGTRWSSPDLGAVIDPQLRVLAEHHVLALVVLTPLAVFAISMGIWSAEVSRETWGLVALAAGALLGLVMFALWKIDEALAHSHLVVVVSLITIGLALIFQHDADVLLIAMSVEAASLVFVGNRFSDRVATALGGLLYIPVATLLAMRLASPGPSAGELPFLNFSTLSSLTTIGMAVGVSFLSSAGFGRALRAGAYLALLVLPWHQLILLGNGLETMVFVWAVYAVTLHAASGWLLVGRGEQHELERGAHAAAALSGITLFGRIVFGLLDGNTTRIPFFNLGGLFDLGTLIVGLIALYLLTLRQEDRRTLLSYAAGLHVLFMGLLWQEIGLMPDGNGWVSIAWGLYSVLLIGAWVWLKRDPVLFYLGVSTLFAIAAKLFLIDAGLYRLPTLWRILLFLGFGTLFLVLSYFFGGTLKRMLTETGDLEPDAHLPEVQRSSEENLLG